MRRIFDGFADLFCGLVLVAAADVLLFHQGLYFPLLRPDSYSGRVEAAKRRIVAVTAVATKRQLVVMGDSTAASCVAEAQLESALALGGLELGVINLAEGGSTARSWYKLLATPAIHVESTAVVVLGVHPAALNRTETKDADLQIFKTRLDLKDFAILPWSYRETERQLRVASAVWFRTPLFREDLIDFAATPRGRLKSLAAARREEGSRLATGWRRGPQAMGDLATAHLDAGGNLDRSILSPAINEELAGFLEQRLRQQSERVVYPAMEIEEGQAEMLSLTVEMLGRRGIPVVVAVTPRSPVRLVGRPMAALEALVAQLRRRGERALLYHDEEMLDEVEDLGYFADQLHVNAAGARLYTAALAKHLLGAAARGELEGPETVGMRQAR